MSAKIQIKSDMVGIFGGIFLMLDHFNKVGLDKLVDKLLGNRRFNAKYSYSDISKTLLATYVTNGSCIEDSKQISGQISEKSQGYRLCSPDVLLNSFKELSTESTFFSTRRESTLSLYQEVYNASIQSMAERIWIVLPSISTSRDSAKAISSRLSQANADAAAARADVSLLNVFGASISYDTCTNICALFLSQTTKSTSFPLAFGR